MKANLLTNDGRVYLAIDDLIAALVDSGSDDLVLKTLIKELIRLRSLG